MGWRLCDLSVRCAPSVALRYWNLELLCLVTRGLLGSFSDGSLLQGIPAPVLTVSTCLPTPESKHLCQPQEAEVLREEAPAAVGEAPIGK